MTVAACLIVKNEGAVIARCLNSVRGLVQAVVIVDTGSTDDTLEVIRGLDYPVPIRLYQRLWQDFAHNRTESILLAAPEADYILLLDADQTVEGHVPALTADGYHLKVRTSGVEYPKLLLIRAALPWRFEGVVHEYLVCEQAGKIEFLEAPIVREHGDGGRRPAGWQPRWEWDAEVLEKELARNPNNPRYVFYLARSYDDLATTRPDEPRADERRQKAMARYRERSRMAGYPDEAFYSLLRLGVMKLAEGDGLTYLMEAWQRCPHRWEPVHEAVRWLNQGRLFDASYALSKRALAGPAAPSGLFVHTAVFDHLLLFEHSISAYWVGQYQESWDNCQTLLGKQLSAPMADAVRRNMAFAKQRLEEHAPSAGPAPEALAQRARGNNNRRRAGMKLHLLGIFHSIHAPAYSHCPFTDKCLRFSKMMQAQGFEVVEYANEGSLSEAREKVVVLNQSEFQSLSELYKREFPNESANVGSTLCKTFEQKLIKELVQRAQPGDIICHPFGMTHSRLSELLPQCYHVETGIGYNDVRQVYKIFESYAWWHYHQGKRNQPGNFYEWVIPMSYDLQDWEPSFEPGEYILYFGRLVQDKGLAVVQEIAKRTGRAVLLCGNGDARPWLDPSIKNLRAIPPVSGKARSDLLRKAYCTLMPTLYTEPFGSGGVEGMLCGTPLIASDFGAFSETVQHGVTGFRCKTLGDWLYAVERAGSLDRKFIAEYTRTRHSIETCGKLYARVFEQIQDLRDKGWYTPTPIMAIPSSPCQGLAATPEPPPPRPVPAGPSEGHSAQGWDHAS